MGDNRNIYIGRAHPILGDGQFGNPYRVSVHGRREAIRLYTMNITLTIDQIALLKSKRSLACWCDINQQCHGDALLRLLNES